MKELDNLIKKAIDSDRQRTREHIINFNNEFVKLCGKDLLAALLLAGFLVVPHLLSCSFALENKNFYKYTVKIRLCSNNIIIESILNKKTTPIEQVVYHSYSVSESVEYNSEFILKHLNLLNTRPY